MASITKVMIKNFCYIAEQLVLGCDINIKKKMSIWVRSRLLATKYGPSSKILHHKITDKYLHTFELLCKAVLAYLHYIT